MQITVLGSGTSIPHPRRSSSGYWLETAGGSILLDCSATVPNRLASELLDWPSLDAIWISHFHLDHCGGLAPFLGGTKHASQMRQRTKPLRIFGGAGIERLIDRFDAVNGYRLLEQPFPIDIVEVDPLAAFEIVPGVKAVAFSTPHTDESLAIHITDKDGKTLVYSADTGFDESVAAFANRVDLFILEASYPNKKPVKKHLELAEAVYLVRKAQPQSTMLTHLYPDWDGLDVAAEAAKIDENLTVIEAVDGLRLTI